VAPDGTTWESYTSEGDGSDCGVISSPVSGTAGVWQVRVKAFGALAPPNVTTRVAATTATTSTPGAATTATVQPETVAAFTTTVKEDQAYAWLSDDPASCTSNGARAASIGFTTFDRTGTNSITASTIGGGCSIGGVNNFARQSGLALAISNLYGTTAKTVAYRPVVTPATVEPPLGQPVTMPLLTGGAFESPQQLRFNLRAGDTIRFAITCPTGSAGDITFRIVGPSNGPEDDGGRGTINVRTAGACPPEVTFVADTDGSYTFAAEGGIGASLTVTPTIN
jgi:hypothetical protein